MHPSNSIESASAPPINFPINLNMFMFFLLPLQGLLDALYYATAPFTMTPGIWAILMLNYASLVYLWLHHFPSSDMLTSRGRIARMAFTLTLILLEFLGLLADTPFSPEGAIGLINDIETLVTGIVLGVLWHREIVGGRNFLSK